MIRCEPFTQPDAKVRFDFGFHGRWDTRHMGDAVMKLLALMLRGLLAAGAAAVVVAYRLLTNSHL